MCVCVTAICTILQFTLVTHGHFFRVGLGATKGTYIPIITHNILIIIVLLCKCGPYMCRYVFPRTIWRVPYTCLQIKNCCKCKSTRTYSCYSVPDPLHMFLTSEQVLNMCPKENKNIIALLLSLGQSLSTDKWACHMEVPLVCTIHGANHNRYNAPCSFCCCFGPFAIPNENIRRCPVGQRTNPNDVPKSINGKIRSGCLNPAFSGGPKEGGSAT